MNQQSQLRTSPWRGGGRCVSPDYRPLLHSEVLGLQAATPPAQENRHYL